MRLKKSFEVKTQNRKDNNCNFEHCRAIGRGYSSLLIENRIQFNEQEKAGQ